ncbi:MAG: UDP-N-acetylmuramate dehydrogenase [Rhodospirillales bacterium]|nr:UDP-N-acetylmuramate dehydrogenase [Rhodospirillales bacterium]
MAQMTKPLTGGLIERLPKVRGHYEAGFDLSKITWFRVGGPAEVMFRPADADDLAGFLSRRSVDVPVSLVVGVGSNLLIRDGGVPGVVIRLGREMGAIVAKGTDIRAGAGAMDIHVARAAMDAGIEGLEFLNGIPGTIGGALRMNAGAYGTELKDIFVEAEALDRNGTKHRLRAEDMGFSYRSCAIAADWIFTSVHLRGQKGRREDIERRMVHIQSERETTQPVRFATGGSTFKNPAGASAWELIEQAGCRGMRRGGAVVSEKHCNFLINTGDASAADLEGLGEEVRRRVAEVTGVELEWEIRRVGVADPALGKETP